MCCTSPVGSIVQEGPEVEICDGTAVPTSPADIYVPAFQLSAESAGNCARLRQEQSETMAGVTSTESILTEAETRTAPQASSQSSEGIEGDLPEQ